MQYTESISNINILGIVRRSCNYVDSRLMEHGFRVSRLVSLLLRSYGKYSQTQLRDICFLSIIHDIGAYKTEEISRLLQFETDNVWDHSIYGYLFIQYFSPLSELAAAVLLHHVPWNKLEAVEEVSPQIKELSQIIHIADRIDVALNTEQRTLAETLTALQKNSGSQFSPSIIELASKTLQASLEDSIQDDNFYHHALTDVSLTPDEISEYLKMIIFAIDFRSRYTVTHTITTASISYELGRILGIKGNALDQLLCGALLHDLGKIGIPVEILECPGKLSPQNMNIMRTHVDITEAIFGDDVEETIQKIALRHHEKLDGSGYPKGLSAKDLTLSQRIVAIADIVSALAGTRSYKTAFSKDRVISIIEQMKELGVIDGDVVDTMIFNYDDIMEKNRIQCEPIVDLYSHIQTEYERFQKLVTTQKKENS